jgi:chromate transport protein ChrA
MEGQHIKALTSCLAGCRSCSLNIGQIRVYQSLIYLNIKVMSQKEANEVNKTFRAMVIVVAIVLAIVALFTNPGHLFTAGLIYAFGCEAEIAKADEFDLRK